MWKERYSEQHRVQAEITRWKDHTQRLRGGLIDGQLIGAERQNSVSDAFFAGEAKSEILAGRYNEINNPIGLVRPYTLQHPSSFAQACTFERATVMVQFPYKPSRSNEERTAARYGYIEAVKIYEESATSILSELAKSTFDPHSIKRMLENKLGSTVLFMGIPGYDYRKLLSGHSEQPVSWLMHIALSILNHPSEDIEPEVRRKALSLLNLYKWEDYRDSIFTPVFSQWKPAVGFDTYHIGRIPQQFQGKNDRLKPEHIYTWQDNERLKSIVYRDASGDIFWLSTIQYFKQYPNEAVQLALLLLHDRKNAPQILQFLREIPNLDRQLALQMLSQSASFLAEHQLKKRAEASREEGPQQTSGGQEDEMKRLQTELQEARAKLVNQQEALKSLRQDYIELLQRGAQLEARYEAEIARLRAQTEARDRDPQSKYFKVLGLDPHCFDKMTEEQKTDFLGVLRREYGRQLHPDRSNHRSRAEKKAAEERLQEINAAIDALLKKEPK